MITPYLSPLDEHYCQLRSEGCDPTYAAMVSRDYPPPGIAANVAAINEASMLIHQRFVELGCPELVPAFEHPAPRMRGIEEAAHAKRIGSIANWNEEWVDDPHPFDGFLTTSVRTR